MPHTDLLPLLEHDLKNVQILNQRRISFKKIQLNDLKELSRGGRECLQASNEACARDVKKSIKLF